MTYGLDFFGCTCIGAPGNRSPCTLIGLPCSNFTTLLFFLVLMQFRNDLTNFTTARLTLLFYLAILGENGLFCLCE